jgi:cyclic pyranopterin phosphate synthase
MSGATDKLGRPVRDLRVSVTDRCNFRCTYCMPREVFGHDFQFLPASQILSFEEIARLARVFARLGVEKVRITGGEPLLRRHLDRLVGLLARTPGIGDLTLTTNGSLLPTMARRLRDAGLKRLTVSLDSLDDAVFRAMNDVDFPVSRVLEGIEAAVQAGFSPIKLNTVVKRGVNDSGIVALAQFAREHGHVLRFIEYMDVGASNGWRLDEVVTAAEILDIVDAAFPLEPLPPTYRGEVATRHRYKDGGGEIGVVASVSRPFCRDCTRARVSAQGVFYTCLFATGGTDLRAPLRSGASDAEILRLVSTVWGERADRYSELRTEATSIAPRVEMSHIGG